MGNSYHVPVFPHKGEEARRRLLFNQHKDVCI